MLRWYGRPWLERVVRVHEVIEGAAGQPEYLPLLRGELADVPVAGALENPGPDVRPCRLRGSKVEGWYRY